MTDVYATSDPRGLEAALRAMQAGGVVAFPTDTVYGLGCDWTQEAAVAALYAAKQRPFRLPIPILVSAPDRVLLVARDLPPGLAELVAAFWPGGLTVVLPARECVPAILLAGGSTVAVRMPDDDVALAVIDGMGGALAVTSANLSSRPSPVTAPQVLEDLDGRISVLLDGGPCVGGIASTIVDLVSVPSRVLRPGAIDFEDLAQYLPDLLSPRS